MTKGVQKVTKSAFFRPINDKMAQNRPLFDPVLVTFLAVLWPKYRENKALLASKLSRRCPGTCPIRVLEDTDLPAKQNGE